MFILCLNPLFVFVCIYVDDHNTRMGLLFSKCPEQEQLITENVMVLLAGDLILVASTDLEITLNSDLWAHVGLVVRNNATTYVYHNGVFEHADDYVYRHHSVDVRQLKVDICPQQLYASAQESANIMLSTTMSLDDREGFAIAYVLKQMGVWCPSKTLHGLRPSHFSNASLVHYTMVDQ